MPEFVYTMEDLRKVVGTDRVLLDGITLAFLPGAKIGVLGPNGAGKSTLLRIMAGVDEEFAGEARPTQGVRVGYLPQEPMLDPQKDVLGNVEEGVAGTRALLREFEELSDRFAEPMEPDEMDALLEKQGKLQDRIEAVDAWELDRALEVAMDALRLPAPDADVTRLSGGELRRVALCQLLLQKPDLLLLDEPTNHLDAESVAWLERFLQEYAGTVVAITHDRYFLDNVAGWILELDRGRGIPFEGNYSAWLEAKRARLAVEERRASARSRSLDRELEWIRMTPRARQAKGRARLNAYEQLRAEEESRAPESVELVIPPGPRLGDVVIEAQGLCKGYGGNLLIDELSFSLPPAGIVGVIGANGAGKTTLFRMLVGEEQPDAGRLRIGETAVLAYVDQSRDALDPEQGDPVPRLRGTVRLQGAGPAEARRHALGRRAQSRAPGTNARGRWQRAAAGRAVERPGRRHAASTRRGPARLLRLRGRDLARSLVPRPHRHPHPGLRGRFPCRVVRGQLRGLREGPQEAHGRGRGPAAPDQVPPHRRLADALSRWGAVRVAVGAADVDPGVERGPASRAHPSRAGCAARPGRARDRTAPRPRSRGGSACSAGRAAPDAISACSGSSRARSA
jgi:ATP-binding cassette ChvD family protein